jgi:hypothetical protein
MQIQNVRGEDMQVAFVRHRTGKAAIRTHIIRFKIYKIRFKI